MYFNYKKLILLSIIYLDNNKNLNVMKIELKFIYFETI